MSLFLLDHSRICKSSACIGVEEYSGTNKVVSSAYFRMVLKFESGLRSIAYIMNKHGPIPDPWTMLAVIGFHSEKVTIDLYCQRCIDYVDICSEISCNVK